MTTPPAKRTQPRKDIFTEFPASDHRSLIVRYADDHDGRLGYCFAEAADRLAGTHRGSAPDDALLLPYLFLYRHAIELDVKHSIKFAAQLRRNDGDSSPEVLEPDLTERLQHKHGHRLLALVEELDKHLTALKLETTPSRVRRTLNLVARVDPRGENFRYSGSLPAEQDNIDFSKLSAALADAYRALSTAQDILSVYQDYQSDAQEAYRSIQADIEAEMRREYEDYS